MKKITLILFLFTYGGLMAQDQLLSSVNESFNSSSSTWTINYGDDYSYDANGNLQEHTDYFWDSSTSTWSPSYKTVYLYNANNRVIQELSRLYNSSTQQFEDESRIFYTYDSNNNLTESRGEQLTNGAWVNSYRDVFNYTGNRITSFLIEEWNGLQWINEEQGSLFYNANNQLTSVIYEEWISNQWEIYSRQRVSYDSNGRLTTTIFDTGDGTNWTVDDTTNYTYDANGNKTSQITIYSGGGFKEEFTHDTSILMSSLDHPFKDKTGIEFYFENNPNINKLLSKNEFNYDSTTMTFATNPDYRTTHNYDTPLSIEEEVALVAIDIKLYPNPTTSSITIEAINTTIQEIRLYDVLGKEIFTTSQTSFDIDQLVNGIYIVKIEDDLGNTTTRKVIKE
jgi:hypothetical protein